MTDDELADEFVDGLITMGGRSPHRPDVLKECWLKGRESMRAEHEKFCESAQERTDADFKVTRDACEKARDELKAERERSAKLIEALKFYAAEPILDPDYDDAGKSNDEAARAIAEYEASK